MRIGLVGCVKGKRTAPAPARDLYTSALFRGRRRWVEARCDRWYVLSALHGLVAPEQVLAPYDVTLTSAPVARRRAWAGEVLRDLDRTVGDLRGAEVDVLAGAAYRDHGLLDGLRARGARVTVVAEGLSMGAQLAYLGEAARGTASPTPMPMAGGAPTAGGGRYDALVRLLRQGGPSHRTLTFADVEAALGAPLPASARRHRPWWANDRTHTQARAWLDAGWAVRSVSLDHERVTFARSTR
jgi:hypothetical protein